MRANDLGQPSRRGPFLRVGERAGTIDIHKEFSRSNHLHLDDLQPVATNHQLVAGLNVTAIHRKVRQQGSGIRTSFPAPSKLSLCRGGVAQGSSSDVSQGKGVVKSEYPQGTTTRSGKREHQLAGEKSLALDVHGEHGNR